MDVFRTIVGTNWGRKIPTTEVYTCTTARPINRIYIYIYFFSSIYILFSFRMWACDFPERGNDLASFFIFIFIYIIGFYYLFYYNFFFLFLTLHGRLSWLLLKKLQGSERACKSILLIFFFAENFFLLFNFCNENTSLDKISWRSDTRTIFIHSLA